MPSFAAIVSIVFPLLTIVAIGGCALLYGVTTTLRANNGDLKERVDILEAEDKRKDTELSACADKIRDQRSELDALRKVVTGEVHLVAITDLLSHHHAQAVEVWQRLDKTLLHTDVTLTGILATLQGRPL